MSDLPFPAQAYWIGSGHAFDLHEVYLCFRSPDGWRLSAVSKQADLYLTADSRYKLWVNGQFVARGPARCYPESQAVDRLDVTGYLQRGRNLIAVQVYQPGYSHFSYVHRGAAGLLACLVCDGRVELVTDTAWRVRRDPSFASLVPRVSIYGSGVEERDLALADNWPEVDYRPEGWVAPRIVAIVKGPPWTGLRLRELPLLVEHSVPMTLLETRLGPYPAHQQTDPHLALREGWFSAEPMPLPADEEVWFWPQLAAGQAAYWLFDLGRDYTVQGWAEIEWASGQEQLSVSYHEKIRQDDLVISDPDTYCRLRLTDRFRLRPGGQVAETFTLRGGRYLVFQLVGPTGPEFRIRPQARVSEYPLRIDRKLTVDEPALAKIIEMCETTFRACLQDGFVDSTWRESSQWLGDALPQSLIMASMSDDVRPLRQVIEMAAQGAYPDGVLPSVLPGEVHAYTVVDYNFTWIELLRLYQQLTGDDDFVRVMWSTLRRLLDRFDQYRTADGLIINQPGRRLFLDWAPLARSEPSAVYNLRYVLGLQAATELATAHNPSSDEAEQWRRRASAVQTAIRKTFWCGGRWYDDVEQTTFSQLATALAILTNTAKAAEIEGLLAAIIARSLDSDDEPAPEKMVLASPFMHHYLFEALRKHRKFEAALDIIRLRWGRWVAGGYPTTWENWRVDFPDGSQCHAFSAHPRYHLAEIARELGGL
ncbi:MAG: alpha-L-rhamnosidase N-terminal domain-containing protein [Anaerolineae bacterium]|nr:alpha-L-rhamnosidase N-terminal domain-containing protein [Anaerolineae bacterium]